MASAQSPNVSSPVAVGRDAELESMRDALDQLREGQARVILVGGEAGIGKTRLIEEATRQAGDSIRVMRGNCLVLGRTIPYLPFAEMLRGLIRDLPSHTLAALIGPARTELARFMPELALPDPGRTNGSSQKPRMNSEMERLRLYEALLRVAERVATDKPTAFVIEDLQWIDPASLELLAFLAHALDRQGNASLIATVRSEALEDASPVLTFLADIERRADVVRIELGPLSQEATREQVTAILGKRPPDRLATRIHELADGNPLFAEELLAAPTDATMRGDALPPKLRDLLAARLTGLSDDSMAVLRVAAAAGRTIDERLLVEATGLDEDQVDSAIGAAIEEHILTRSQAGTRPSYRFHHEVMRTVVASQLLPLESARIHAAYAKALSAEPIERQNASEIAFHWDESGEVAEALPARIRAGLDAAEAYAFEQAYEHYERALTLWNEVADATSTTGRTYAWLAERTASAAGRAGRTDRAIELTREVITDSDDSDPELNEWARSSLRWFLWESGQVEIARDEAMAVVNDEGVTGRWRANALGHLSGLLLAEQQTAEAQAYATEALELARSVGADEEAILAQGVLGWCLVLDGQVDAGLDAIRGTVEAARSVDVGAVHGRYPVGLALAHTQLAAALELAGRFDEVVEVAKAGIEVAARYGIARTYGSLMQANASRALYQLGRWDAADAESEAALGAGAVGSGRTALLTVRALVAVGRGQTASAEATLADATNVADPRTPLDVRRWMVAAHAEHAIWQARSMEALLQLAVLGDDADSGSAAGGQPSMLDASVPLLVALAARAVADLSLEERAAGDGGSMSEAAAEQVRASLKRVGKRKGLADAWAADISVARAELERASKDGAGTTRRWKAAAAATGDRPYAAAYTRWRLAEALLAKRDGREAAAPIIEEGLRLAEALGARPLLDRLQDLARRAGLKTQADDGSTAVAPAGSGRPFGLTTREVEVLALLADGRSNQEIADHLFISPKTASVHVSNIYGKLGVESRVAAATTAQSLGIVSPPPEGEAG